MKVIECHNVSYLYPNGLNAINGIDFSIEENETLGIIGPNGAGKTTLFLALCGIIPFEGEITICNTKLTKSNTQDLRKNLGFVFQNPDDQLFMPTVYEDIAFGPINLGFSKDEVDCCVKKALRNIGLSDFEDRITHHLSFGEKKRVALATVLSMSPKILLLDEPTSELDPWAKNQFIDLISKIKGTKIIASHDLQMIIDLCDKIMLLNKGKILEITENTKDIKELYSKFNL
ncbi:MAG: ABC transporter ATP-binding protein [bacterium]|nr:ABC transporter ATP-binding protein [bacterium]